jgi:uncharacterized membrane protein (DUF373 family)
MTEQKIAVPTRWLERAEIGIYLATAVLLVATAAGLLVLATTEMVQRLLAGNPLGALLHMLDRALLLLMLAEIIYTVRRVAQKQRMTAEPFFIVAIIAAIRRMLIITAESATHVDMQDPAFQAAMVELALLGFLILALAGAMRLLRLERVGDPPKDS